MEETKQRAHQFRTPLDTLASLASSFFFSAFSLPSLSPLADHGSKSLLSATVARALSVLRHLLLLGAEAFASLFYMFLSALAPPAPPPAPALRPTLPPLEPEVHTTCVGRALAHVLSVVSWLPVSSRKYELVRGLAEGLLDDSVRAGGDRVGAVNRAVLAGAFARTMRQLETKAAAGGEWLPGGIELAARAVRSGVHWLRTRRPAAAAAASCEGFGGSAAEKLAAELMWLAQKMAECGAAREAVAQFGKAARLGRRVLVAEPTLQVSLLRLAVFLFKHANSKEFEQSAADKGTVAEQRTAMLRSWLPLLCRGSNGTDAPVLSSRERSEMVGVLEELIGKLNWEQQEEILALWLHHFAACLDTDWPNLETCYTRWYTESIRLLE